MEFLKKLFPFSLRVKERDISSLIVLIVAYVIAALVLGFLLGMLARFTPFIGFVFDLVAYLVDLYVTGGIVVAILYYVKVIK